MADKKLAQLRTLFAKMPEGAGKDAVAKKIAKLEASQPKEVVEVKEEVKVETKKAKAPRKPKATKSASGKEMRHVFEKEVEGGKEVKVVMATSPELAKEAMQESGFEFVKTITRGRSPKEGFIATGKAKKTKAKAPARASKATRESMAKDAGMTAEKAEKVASKVASSKKRGRKPMDKKAFLFEMPLKTQAGKVKRKVVTATSEASAIKAAGKNYTLVKELEKGENPKVGVQPMEGFVAPAPKKRGRKPKAKTLEEVTEKAEAIGEGIAIADRYYPDADLDTILSELLALQKEVRDVSSRAALVYAKLKDFVKFEGKGKKTGDKKMAHGGTTHEKIKISDSDMKKLHEGKEVTISGVTLDFARGGRVSMQEKEDIKKASEAMNDHLDKVGMSLRAFDESRPPSGVYRSLIGRYGWTDFDANVNSKEEFLFESDAIEDFTKYLKKAYPVGKKMAHGGMHRQGYDDKLDESLAMRRGAGRSKQQSRKDRRDESAGMEKSMGRRKYSSVGTMDIDDRMI